MTNDTGNAVDNDTHDTLQELLDGQLSPAAALEISRRLGADSALAQSLEQMEEDRDWRVQAWRSLEPDDAAAGQLAGAIISSVRRDDRRRRLMVWARGPAVAAACLAVFAAGWVARGRTGGAGEGFSSISARSDQTWNFDASGAPTRGMVNVAMTDESGRVIAVQRFNEIGQARQFADDLATWQARRQQAQQGRMQRVGEEF